MLTLLGPSGCGKTTTLRCIAGLERAGRRARSRSPGGCCSLRGRDVGAGPPPRPRDGVPVLRPVAPHERVRNGGVPAGGRPARAPALGGAQSRERVERTLASCGSTGSRAGRPPSCRGGQQQRLALARALVMEPPLLLMDEPLSNLDAGLREDMRLELKRLQRELGLTAVYVTHDQAEALALSTYVGGDARRAESSRWRGRGRCTSSPGSPVRGRVPGRGQPAAGRGGGATGTALEVSPLRGRVTVSGEGRRRRAGARGGAARGGHASRGACRRRASGPASCERAPSGGTGWSTWWR